MSETRPNPPTPLPAKEGGESPLLLPAEGPGERFSSDDELVIKIHSIFDELDPQCMAIFRRLSPARRSEMVFEMCDFGRRVVTASVLSHYPDISEEDLQRRVRERVMLAYEYG